MPQRPDLRSIAADIRASLDDMPRERLVDILTYVFKEYVVEGPPPLRLDEQQPLAELGELSFADLIQTLQARLEQPELTWFQVEGGRVSVRVNGVLTPLGGPDNASAAQAGGAVGNGAPGARFVERVEVSASPAPGPTGGSQQRTSVRQASAPPPRRGLSISSRSGGGQGWPVRPNAEPPAPPAPPAADAKAEKKPEPDRPADPSDDISSIRFSLLELD